MDTLNQAEEFVYRICQKSFLSLWSYANPLQKENGKELCDILVVCDPDVIIFSVKDIALGASGDPELDWVRWRRSAIDESVKQVYGAERRLRSMTHVIRKDGSKGLRLPDSNKLRVHCVAVAIGGDGMAPIKFGDFGKGFVHIFDEVSFPVILTELDTITDLVRYLTEKEEFSLSDYKIEFDGASEEDLLAVYLHRNRTFPRGPVPYSITAGLWEEFRLKVEYRRKKLADKFSYNWDTLIEKQLSALPVPGIEPGPSFTEEDQVVRTMAKETRFGRRMLSSSLTDFFVIAKAKTYNARIVTSTSKVTYVFLYATHGTSAKDIEIELQRRCFIARGKVKANSIVIGIAFEEWATGGSMSTLCYFEWPDWTIDDEYNMQKMIDELGYFKTPRTTKAHEKEYPDSRIVLPPGLLSSTAGSLPRRVGRNAQCPCGNGRKFKHCHGA